jgi:dephospho-CoA kinase
MIVGLTGSIASGKSEVARILRQRGLPVFDADAAVHELYQRSDVASGVARLFPGSMVDGKVDRARLSAALRQQPASLTQLEALVHPLVRAERAAFMSRHASAPIAVLDIPLLFETGSDKEVDITLTVTTTPELQRQRALARPGMTVEKLDFILANQMPAAEKAAMSDYVIDNSGTLEELERSVDRLLPKLAARATEKPL